VGNDIGDGETLMGVEVQHSCDKILELIIEESVWLSV